MEETTNTTQNTYKIYETNLTHIEEKLSKLNKKAVKLNCQPITLNILSTELVKTEDYTDKVYTITITGESPILNNWQFIGTIEHHSTGNIVKVINNATYPEKYLTIDNTCEHCQTIRKRKDTYLVHNTVTDEYKAVGKSCLKDFTGHADILSYVTLMESLLDTDWLEEFTGIPTGSGSRGINLDTYLSHVAYHIRNTGWRSRNKIQEDGYGIATCDQAFSGMFPFIQKDKIHPIEQDQELANKSIEWAKTLSHDNSYLQAINIIASEESTSIKNIGFSASIVSSYIRHIEKQIEQERKAAERKEQQISAYVGTPGQKIQIELTYVTAYSFDTQWGTTWIYKFMDNSGNILVWKTSNYIDCEQGQQYTIKATIKEHNEYRDEKQTILTRCKVTA